MTVHKATLRYLRIAPRKARLVADVLRGLPVNDAEARLLTMRQRAAKPVLKLLRSALRGAKDKHLDTEKLYIEEIRVDQGPMLHRYMPRARGGMSEIQKKMSHVILALGENPAQKPGKFTIPEPKKKSKDTETKRARKPKAEKAEAEQKPEPKKQPGFFQRTFRRKSGDGS